MGYTLTEESFASLESYRTGGNSPLRWQPLFILPPWLGVWWEVFGGKEKRLYLRGVWEEKELLGVAPLYIEDDRATFIGSPDVCDYLDFIVSPGRQGEFFAALLDDLTGQGIRRLDLQSVRPDSFVMTSLLPLARERGCKIIHNLEDVSLEMELPAGWEDYLARLSRKQRHELRRKLRRLEEEGEVNFRLVEGREPVEATMDVFLRLLALNPEKSHFLTAHREEFFRSLAGAMAEAGLLRLGVLELDKVPEAVVMAFDYQGCVYLYNNGYHPEHPSTSLGTVSKALLIRDAIQRGRKRFDFLKGGEVYKYQMGGREVPLYHCEVHLPSPKGRVPRG
ncbi:MAG: GNAT family N-acetyltransferase [Chloroflexota bacterium]